MLLFVNRCGRIKSSSLLYYKKFSTLKIILNFLFLKQFTSTKGERVFKFNLHFFEQKIYTKRAFVYKNNQFLTEMLNLKITEELECFRKILISNKEKLKLYSDITYVEITNYNEKAQATQNVFSSLTTIFQSLSIFENVKTYDYQTTQELFDLFNRYDWFWGGISKDDDDLELIVDDECYIMKFYPSGIEYGINDTDLLAELIEFNEEIDTLFDGYITFTDDLLRVKNLYQLFIDEYLHKEKKFLDHKALAEVFTKFITDIKKKNKVFESGDSRFTHTVLSIDDDSFLAETYNFKSLGAFLYHDLFLGIKNNHIPKKCDHCGKYYLLEAGKYTDYCDAPLDSDNEKTCRDVGSRRRYDDKCKTDPIWLTYNRAYKAHYARYMKKKMTVGEFEKWSSYAVLLRDKAEREEISFEEYEVEIKR